METALIDEPCAMILRNFYKHVLFSNISLNCGYDYKGKANSIILRNNEVKVLDDTFTSNDVFI